MIRNCMIHNLADKIHDRLQSSDILILQKDLPPETKSVSHFGSPYDYLRRAFQNPQSRQQPDASKLCNWNYSRSGTRCRAIFHKFTWSSALALSTNDNRSQVIAIRWHLGILPIPNACTQYLNTMTTYGHYNYSRNPPLLTSKYKTLATPSNGS